MQISSLKNSSYTTIGLIVVKLSEVYCINWLLPCYIWRHIWKITLYSKNDYILSVFWWDVLYKKFDYLGIKWNITPRIKMITSEVIKIWLPHINLITHQLITPKVIKLVTSVWQCTHAITAGIVPKYGVLTWQYIWYVYVIVYLVYVK